MCVSVCFVKNIMARDGSKSGGRPKGSRNRATLGFKLAVEDLLNKNEKEMMYWLSQVANGMPEHEIKPNPAKALEIVNQLAEYVAPKLSRVESKSTVDMTIQKIQRTIKRDNAGD